MDSSSQDDRSVKSNQNGTRRQRLTEEQEQQLVQEYLAGDGLKELAVRWGFTATGIWHLLRRRNVPRRTTGEGLRASFAKGNRPNNPRYKLTAEQVRESIRRYVEDKASIYDIAFEMGCSKTNILSYLKRKGVLRRTSKETRNAHWESHPSDYPKQRYYQKAKESGLCVWCLRPNPTERSTCEACRAKHKGKRDARKAKGLCTACGKTAATDGRLCHACRERFNGYYRKARDEAFAAYGGYRCVCCGETEPVFLCLDHINNDGSKHRRGEQGMGYRLYQWLKKNNYPEGLQVMCWNCNSARHILGVCPHQRMKT